MLNFYENFEQSNTVPYCSLGLHPWYLENADRDFKILKSLSGQKNVLAIGECGLDKVSETDWQLQESVFQKQIALANDMQKPLIIHCVRAHNECVKILAAAKVPVIFHGFNRNTNIAQLLLDKGFYLSIGAVIFRTDFETIFKELPIDKIFFETDDKTDVSIASIYKRAAEIKNIALESLILQVETNFQKVFVVDNTNNCNN